MNNLELEFKRWMNDFEAHGSFRTVRHAPLKCITNEFVFYYNPNSVIEKNAGRFFITNRKVVFDIPMHGVTDIPLSDIDVNYIGLDSVEITQGTTSVHVRGNGNIMFTLIVLLKHVDGAKYVRHGFDTVNHVKDELELLERAANDGTIPIKTADLMYSFLSAYGAWYQNLVDNCQLYEMENNTTIKVYDKERVIYSQDQATLIHGIGEEKVEILLTDYRLCFKNENWEVETAIEDISRASANHLILTLTTDTHNGATTYKFGNVLAPLICNALSFIDSSQIPNWIYVLSPRDEDDPPNFTRTNNRASRLDELKNSVEPQYFEVMNFEFKCPQCGMPVEVDESLRGRVVVCPHCEKNIVVPRSKPQLGVDRNTTANQRPAAPRKEAPAAVAHGAQMVPVKCPHCGTEYDAEENEYGMFEQCAVCGKGFIVGQTSLVRAKDKCANNGKSVRLVDVVAAQLARIDQQLEIVNAQIAACRTRECFGEQCSLFESDWAMYKDDLFPKRLQFEIDGLRARLSGAHSDRVANAVRSSEATNQTFGTTVGLRNPDSLLYGLGRDLVQLGGHIKGIVAVRERNNLDGAIDGMEDALGRYEAMMNYYFDLCSEFRDKDKQTARSERLKARCGICDELELPPVDIDKSEDTLQEEKNCLLAGKKKLQQTLKLFSGHQLTCRNQSEWLWFVPVVLVLILVIVIAVLFAGVVEIIQRTSVDMSQSIGVAMVCACGVSVDFGNCYSSIVRWRCGLTNIGREERSGGEDRIGPFGIYI